MRCLCALMYYNIHNDQLLRFFGKYPAMDVCLLLPECHDSEAIFDWSRNFMKILLVELDSRQRYCNNNQAYIWLARTPHLLYVLLSCDKHMLQFGEKIEINTCI